jgi:hypothetical protein
MGMTLINTEGMTFIGPGSEWFWTALSGLVLAITFVAIYRQLKLQTSAGAIEQVSEIERGWTSENMARSRLEVLVALRDGTPPAELPGHASGELMNFWERVGYLVHQGHIGDRLVHSYLSNSIQTWWAWLIPSVEAARRQFDVPGIGEEFEWLAARMSEIDREAGDMPAFDAGYLARQLKPFIDTNLAAIRRAEELRAVFVRSPGTHSADLSKGPR